MDADFPVGMLDSIRDVLAGNAARESGLDVYDDVFNSALAFPLQRQKELAWVMRQSRSIAPRVVMEIGVDKSGGLIHWTKCLPTVETVIACDIRGTPYSSLFEAAFSDVQFLWLERSSHSPEAVASVRDFLVNRKIDCLFIDGDTLAIAKDFDAYFPFMNHTGVVFVHDIKDHAPNVAFRQLADRGYRHERFVDTSDAEAELALEAKGIPPATPHAAWLRHWRGESCGVGALWMDGTETIAVPPQEDLDGGDSG
jgi:hypothetical protein